MLAVGLAVLAVYAAVAALVYLLLRSVLLAPSELTTTLALARALRKIEAATRPGIDLLSPLYVSGNEEEPLRWLSTHPAVEDRVERLRRRAAGDTRAGAQERQ